MKGRLTQKVESVQQLGCLVGTRRFINGPWRLNSGRTCGKGKGRDFSDAHMVQHSQLMLASYESHLWDSFLYPVEMRGPVMVPGAVTPGVCIQGPSVPTFRIQSIAVRQFLDFASNACFYYAACSMLQFKGEKELVPFMMSGIRYPSCFRASIPLYSPQCVYSVQKNLEGTRTCHAPRWPSLARRACSRPSALRNLFCYG